MLQANGDSTPRSQRLLAAGEASPVIVQNPGGRSPFVLIGDHAGREVPRRLADLGLTETALSAHIGWDIGVAGMGARLSERIDAPFIRQRYSRLVIDCNRRLDADDLIPAVSDGIAVPGNADLTGEEIAARRDEVWAPYHVAIAEALDAAAAAGRAVRLVSLHSFTPVMQGFARPWRIGVLHRGDSQLSRRMLQMLRERLGETAGDNEPYRMDTVDNTIPLHADPRGLDYLELEVRQDLIADEAGQAWAAGLIGELLQRVEAVRPGGRT